MIKSTFLISILFTCFLFESKALNTANQDDGIKDLVVFLTSVNSYLYKTAMDKSVYTPAHFSDFIVEHYEDRDSYGVSIRKIQMLLNDNARLLGVDAESEEGMNAVINHILLSKEDRLKRFEGLDKNDAVCHLDYIKEHQHCLLSAVLDGLFERVNATVGAGFLNCQAKATDVLFDCVN